MVVLAAGCGDDTERSRVADSPPPTLANGTTRLPVSSAELASLPEERLGDCVMGLLFAQVKGAAGVNEELERIHQLTPVLQGYWAAQMLEGEVGNGGFNQFFFNSSGAYISDAIAGFQLFGLKDHAAVAHQALVIADRPQERERREEARRAGDWEAFAATYKGTDLNPVDDRFFDLPEATPVENAYLRQHLDQVAAAGATGSCRDAAP